MAIEVQELPDLTAPADPAVDRTQITASDLVGITPSEAPRQFATEEEERPSFFDAVLNAGLRENQTVAIYHHLRDAKPWGDPDPNFNPYRFIDDHRDEFGDLVPLATGDEAERFMSLQNEAQFRQFADLLREEKGVKDIAESRGVLPYFIGGVAGMVADPASWLSGAALGKVYSGWRVASRTGALARNAFLGAAFQAQHEAVLQSDQVLRSPEESYMAIGLGGGLGAFSSVFTKVRGADVPGDPLKPPKTADEFNTHPLSPDSDDIGEAIPSNPEAISAYAASTRVGAPPPAMSEVEARSFLNSIDTSSRSPAAQSAVARYATAKTEADVTRMFQDDNFKQDLDAAAIPAPRDLVLFRGSNAAEDLNERISAGFYTPTSLTREWAETMAEFKWSRPALDTIVVRKGDPIIPINHGDLNELEILLPRRGEFSKNAEKVAGEDVPYVTASGHTSPDTWSLRDWSSASGGARSLSAAAAPTGTQAGPGSSLGAMFDKVTPIGRAVRMSRQFVNTFRPTDRAPTAAESLADDAVSSAFGNTDKLINTRVVTEANLRGEASGQRAEDLARQLREITVTRTKTMHDLHNEMLREVYKGGSFRNAVGIPKIGLRDFEQEVYRYRNFQRLDDEGSYRPTPGLALNSSEEISRFSQYVKRAAGNEDAFYDLWGKLMAKEGMLDEADLSKHYFPQIYERDVIAGNADEFKSLLRERFAKDPDADWLENNYQTRDINTLTPADRDLARADWEASNKAGAERAAEEATERAAKRLDAAKKGVVEASKDVTLTRNAQVRKALNEVRLAERESQKRLQLASTERERLNALLDDLSVNGAKLRDLEAVSQYPLVPTFQGAPVRVAGVSDDLLATVELPTGTLKRKVQFGELEWKPVADVASVPKNVVGQLEVLKEFEVKASIAAKRVKQLESEIVSLERSVQHVSTQRAAAEAELRHAKEMSASARKELSAAMKERRAAMREARSAEAQVKKLAKVRSTDEQVDDIVNGILNFHRSPFGFLPPDLVAASGRTKARNIDWKEMIHDPRLQKFLNRDPETMAVRFTEDVAPRIALRRIFGSENLEETITSVRGRFDQAIAAAESEGNTKLAEFLRDKLTEWRKDFVAVRDRVMGRYGLPEDPNSALMWFSRRIRENNFVRMMGKVLLSSVTDIATGQLATNSAFGFLPTLTKNTAKLVAKIPDEELRALLIGYENMIHYSRTLQSFGLDDTAVAAQGFGQGRLRDVTGRIGQVSQDATTLMNRANGMRWWNRRMRVVFGTVAMQNLRKDLANWANLPEKTRTLYLRHGLDDDAAERITKLFNEASEEIDKGVIIPQSQKWLDTDPRAYAQFRDALGQIMDEAIIVPGAGDTPLLMSKEMGRLMFQFQSFAFASVNRYLRPLVQRRDGLAMASLTTGLALGGLNWVARQALNGKLDEVGSAAENFTENGDTKIFFEALVRSPLIGHMGMPLEFLTQAFGGPINAITEDATGLKPIPQSSRFAERNAFLIPLGPSVGTLEDVVSFGQQGLKVLGPEATEEDSDRLARKLVRLLPFMSLGYVTGVANSLGAPGFAPQPQ